MPKPVLKNKKNPAAWIPKTVCVLGTTYQILLKTQQEDADLAGKYGYIWYRMKQIVVKDLYREWPDELIQIVETNTKECLRHEILHAFLFESGLAESSLQYSNGWAKNEEMVDWFALQSPKIFAAYQQVGCL